MSDMLKNAGFMSASDILEETRPLPSKSKVEEQQRKKEEANNHPCRKCGRYRPLKPIYAYCQTCSALMALGTERIEKLEVLGLTIDEACEKVGWEPVVVDWQEP